MVCRIVSHASACHLSDSDTWESVSQSSKPSVGVDLNHCRQRGDTITSESGSELPRIRPPTSEFFCNFGQYGDHLPLRRRRHEALVLPTFPAAMKMGAASPALSLAKKR